MVRATASSHLLSDDDETTPVCFEYTKRQLVNVAPQDPRRSEYYWQLKENAEQVFRYSELRKNKDQFLATARKGDYLHMAKLVTLLLISSLISGTFPRFFLT